MKEAQHVTKRLIDHSATDDCPHAASSTPYSTLAEGSSTMDSLETATKRCYSISQCHGESSSALAEERRSEEPTGRTFPRSGEAYTETCSESDGCSGSQHRARRNTVRRFSPSIRTYRSSLLKLRVSPVAPLASRYGRRYASQRATCLARAATTLRHTNATVLR